MRLFETYQMLGIAWEFLGLQCRHGAGFRRTRDGAEVCRTCGKVEGAPEPFLLLPAGGTKIIGRRTTPTSRRVFPNRRAAILVEDEIRFHGGKIEVQVHNAYRTRIRRGTLPVTIAADRRVRLREHGFTCTIDRFLASLAIRSRPIRPRRGNWYGGLVYELPRRLLRKFPILIRYDDRGRLIGVEIFANPAFPRGRRRRSTTRG